MIFVDSTVPAYLAGTPHAHKADAQRLLEAAIVMGERLVTSAAVLQELMRDYGALGRRDALQPAFDLLLGVTDEVLPVTRPDAERAKELMLGHKKLPAREALHAAVMLRNDLVRVMSFAAGFDAVPGLVRLF